MNVIQNLLIDVLREEVRNYLNSQANIQFVSTQSLQELLNSPIALENSKNDQTPRRWKNSKRRMLREMKVGSAIRVDRPINIGYDIFADRWEGVCCATRRIARRHTNSDCKWVVEKGSNKNFVKIKRLK